MHAFLISTGIVALAKMGDKTQVVTIMLASAPVVWLGRSVTRSRQACKAGMS